MEQRTRRILTWTGVVLAGLAAAALFAALRFPGGSDLMPTFLGACERIYESGLPPLPGDRFCTIPIWHAHANYALDSLLIAAGLAFPCVILALSGRRWSAFLPLLGAPLMTYPLQQEWIFDIGSVSVAIDGAAKSITGIVFVIIPAILIDRSIRRRAAVDAERLRLLRITTVGGWCIASLGLWTLAAPIFGVNAVPSWTGLGGFLINLSLIAAPAAAVMLALQRPHPESLPGTLWHRAIAAALCIGTIAAMAIAGQRLFMSSSELLGLVGYGFGTSSTVGLFLGPSVVIGLFGALLGRRRMWWPWTIFVSAILLSQGPSFFQFFDTALEFKDFWTFYGLAIPFALVGLVGSAWQPLSRWLDQRKDPVRKAPEGAEPRDRRVLRPIVVVNAFALGLLLVAHIMAVGDPFPIEIETPLPTFLGVRVQAQEARMMMNARIAFDAADEYTNTHDSLHDFDAAAGEHLAPELFWSDAIPGELPTGSENWKGFAVLASPRDQDLTFIGRGAWDARTYCFRTDGHGSTTFGISPIEATSAEAIEACEPTDMWTSDEIKPPPELKCYEGTSYLICRMVQVLVHKIMTSPDPTQG